MRTAGALPPKSSTKRARAVSQAREARSASAVSVSPLTLQSRGASMLSSASASEVASRSDVARLTRVLQETGVATPVLPDHDTGLFAVP
jgi:hypothetical protein